MVFSSTITKRSGAGDFKISHGTYTNASGDTGGDINTGLKECHFILIQETGSGVSTNAPVVNETLPVAGEAVTIVTDDNVDGYWIAWGR